MNSPRRADFARRRDHLLIKGILESFVSNCIISMNRLSLELPAVNFSGEFISLTIVMGQILIVLPAAPPWPSLTRVTPTFSPRRLKWFDDLVLQHSVTEVSRNVDDRWVWESRSHVKHANSVSSGSRRMSVICSVYPTTAIREKWGNWMTKVFDFFMMNNFIFSMIPR